MVNVRVGLVTTRQIRFHMSTYPVELMMRRSGRTATVDLVAAPHPGPLPACGERENFASRACSYLDRSHALMVLSFRCTTICLRDM
jgi:hypothetical protein